NTGALTAGTYNTTVTVTCNQATNNPLMIPVTFTVINEPVIVLNPASLTFNAIQGQANPADQVFNVSNIGGQVLSWTASENASWLSLSQYSATGNSTDVTASVNIAGVAPGTYSQTVVVSGNATNSPQNLTVWLALEAAPVISLAPASFSFSAEAGGSNPANQAMGISNTGGSTLNWNASDNAAWLTLSLLNGTAPSSTTLQVASGGLAAGSYSGSITVTCATASNTPQNASVSLSVSAIPFGPTNLVATTVSSTQIDLAWTDNSNIETGFRVKRRLWSSGTWTQVATLPANSVTFSDDTMAGPGTYFYRVCAYNGAGESTYSNDASAALGAVIDTGGANDVGKYTSLAIASNGEPHISYYDATDGNLKYTYRTGAVWASSTVDINNDVGRFSSLTLNAQGYARIAYYDATNSRLRFAKWNGGAWDIVVPDPGADIGQYASLALDAGGNAYIAYFDAANTALKYAYPDGGFPSGFGTATVDDGGGGTGNTGQYCSLVMDGSNYPRISYYSSFPATPEAPGGLRYAEWTGAAWSFTAVDGPSTVGQYTSLAIDATGNPRIAYYDQGSGDLKYAARSAGGAWTVATIDFAGDVGRYASLGADSAGNPKIAYYDATNGNLKVACSFNGGQTWYTYTVDSFNDVGQFCSDPNSKISYYDATAGDLRYIEVELVELIPQDYPVSLVAGWNVFALPVIPLTSYAAEDLA
ncbi:MAG: hypothetical protein RDV41_15035, partial [Planctomycetota bacterium]|nr:hypothetical protein [Planctomycetota bacterium]